MTKSNDSYTRISQSLPILRGVAIVWIVAYHLLGTTKGYLVLRETIAAFSQGGIKNAIEPALQLLISAGNSGVDLFLVISGFGLTASWWKQSGSKGIQTIPLKTFWRKRVFKIFPLFWAAVVLATGCYWINPTWAPFGQTIWQQGPFAIIGAFLATLSTLRNFIPDVYYFLNGAWWYVGLALQLYLIFPVLIRVGQSQGWTKLLTGALILSLIYRGICTVLPLDSIGTTIAFAFFPARLFEFTFGMYLAITFLTPLPQLNQPHQAAKSWLESLLFNPRFLGINLLLFLVGLILKWLDVPAFNIFNELFITVGLFCGMVGLSQFPLPGIQPVFSWLGQYSYGIYLIHMNSYLALWPIASRVLPVYWLRFFIVVAVCCLIGVGFEKLYIWGQQRFQHPSAT